MATVTATAKFSAAHRLIGHGRCHNLHGHNYRVEVTLDGAIDKRGMVFDLDELATILSKIVGNMDHAYLWSGDEGDKIYRIVEAEGLALFNLRAPTTAESIAQEICGQVYMALARRFGTVPHNMVPRVTVWEIDDARASV